MKERKSIINRTVWEGKMKDLRESNRIKNLLSEGYEYYDTEWEEIDGCWKRLFESYEERKCNLDFHQPLFGKTQN